MSLHSKPIIFCLKQNCPNLKKKFASECSITSVSPRCEANNLLDDRVKILQLENLNLNTIIKNFTSSQLGLNLLVGNLGNNSIRHGVGFQSDAFNTKPKRPNSRIVRSF